jgi:hypothetical protein
MLNNLFNASQETNSRILLYPDVEDNEFLITVSTRLNSFTPQKKNIYCLDTSIPLHRQSTYCCLEK